MAARQGGGEGREANKKKMRRVWGEKLRVGEGREGRSRAGQDRPRKTELGIKGSLAVRVVGPTGWAGQLWLGTASSVRRAWKGTGLVGRGVQVS